MYSPLKVAIVCIFLTGFLHSEHLKSTLSSPYPALTNKQGIADRNNGILSKKRYDIFQNKLAIGIQKYNYYWRDAEDAIPSSPDLTTCPKGYMLFPSNKEQKELYGIHNYHCYKKNFIHQWQKRFQQNIKHKIQVSLVLWTSPVKYRDPKCEGFDFGLQRRHLMSGCYPTPEHYDDYEDWIRFTAYQFGKYVDHYIVWNEVDSTNWADTSTSLYSKKDMTKDLKFHMKRSFDIYTELLKRTITAVNTLDQNCINTQENCKNLVYVSLTRDWYSRIPTFHKNKKGAIHIRWRNMNLLDHLWRDLGLEYDWSIAVHPYGAVNSKHHNALTFSTLKDLSAYQKAQIDSRKVKERLWLSYPQSKLFASEQSAGHKVKADDWKTKAKFICESYDVAMRMPELIAITHNHFQDNIHRKNKKPTKHTMLPSSVKKDLSDAHKYETFRAYKSTTNELWNKKNNHYCCETYGIGCKK